MVQLPEIMTRKRKYYCYGIHYMEYILAVQVFNGMDLITKWHESLHSVLQQ
jgi:hypothetical protein